MDYRDYGLVYDENIGMFKYIVDVAGELEKDIKRKGVCGWGRGWWGGGGERERESLFVCFLVF